MLGDEFSDRIKITINKTGETIELDQKRVHIREKPDGLMALSYVAPVFEAMDLEEFFNDVLSSEELSMDIGDTGDRPVRFKGIIDGKGKNFPNNFEHKIILLKEPKLDSRVRTQKTGFSIFKTKEELSE